MTANTQILVYINDAIFFSLAHGTGRAGHEAGCIAAVETGKREKRDVDSGMPPMLKLSHMPEKQAASREVILVLAGHYAGHTAAAPRYIEGEAELDHTITSSFLMGFF